MGIEPGFLSVVHKPDGTNVPVVIGWRSVVHPVGRYVFRNVLVL